MMNVLPKLFLRLSKDIGNMNCLKLVAPLFHDSRNQWVNYYSHNRPIAEIFRLFSSEKSVNLEIRQQDQAHMTETSVAQTDISDDHQDQITKLSQVLNAISNELKILKETNDDLVDKNRRSLADVVNLRSRFHKQVLEAKLFSIQGICKDLLEVADALGGATDSVPQSELTGENSRLKSLYDGLIMAQISLFHAFKRHGLEPMNPLKEKFDPKIHEALYQEENSSVPPGTIIEVSKLGYKLHNRVIRPALVVISK